MPSRIPEAHIRILCEEEPQFPLEHPAKRKHPDQGSEELCPSDGKRHRSLPVTATSGFTIGISKLPATSSPKGDILATRFPESCDPESNKTIEREGEQKGCISTSCFNAIQTKSDVGCGLHKLDQQF